MHVQVQICSLSSERTPVAPKEGMYVSFGGQCDPELPAPSMYLRNLSLACVRSHTPAQLRHAVLRPYMSGAANQRLR